MNAGYDQTERPHADVCRARRGGACNCSAGVPLHRLPAKGGSDRRPWRRCSSCGGVCHWHDTAWVCDECGDEWDREHDPKFDAPGDSA